jgi:nitrate/TMAO reductase-like tetraheme cytochrome c subunit
MKMEPGILKRVTKLVHKERSMRKTLVFSGLILVSLFLVAAKYDYLLEMGDKTAKSSECDQCHKTIYEEWSKDAHSKAYTSDAYRQVSKDYEMPECVSCHAPQQAADEKDLKTRPVHKEEGVNCTTCHLKNHMIYGPYKLTAKHKSEQDESYLKSEFCAGCHMPTFREWQASGSKKTCQECHMPRVEREVVQMGFFYSLILSKRMVGRHYLGYDQLFKDAARITGELGKGTIKISLTNRAGGHNMPTGKYGDYRIVLNTQAKDADGKTIFSKEEIFSTLKKNGIPPKKAVTFEYPFLLEAGKRYQVSSSLFYKMGGRPDLSVAGWSGEIDGGK